MTDATRAAITLRYEDDFAGRTAGYHIMQLLVDDQQVWQEDVAGEDDGEVTVDLSPVIAGRQRARLSVGVADIRGVSNFGVTARMAVVGASGLDLVVGLDHERAWQERCQGGFSILRNPRREGQGRFRLPLIIMAAASRGEYAHRHGEEATPARIAAQVRMALGFVAQGRAAGVVTYCLDKSEGSEDLEAVAAEYRAFAAAPRQEP